MADFRIIHQIHHRHGSPWVYMYSIVTKWSPNNPRPPRVVKGSPGIASSPPPLNTLPLLIGENGFGNLQFQTLSQIIFLSPKHGSSSGIFAIVRLEKIWGLRSVGFACAMWHEFLPLPAIFFSVYGSRYDAGRHVLRPLALLRAHSLLFALQKLHKQMHGNKLHQQFSALTAMLKFQKQYF